MASATKTGPAAPVMRSPRRSSHLKQRKTPLVKPRDILVGIPGHASMDRGKRDGGGRQGELTETLCPRRRHGRSPVRHAIQSTVVVHGLTAYSELNHSKCLREEEKRFLSISNTQYIHLYSPRS